MRASLANLAYSQNSVSIESSDKLIKMLYEGVLKFVSQAKRSVEAEDGERKVYWINKATAIFTELINSIDYDSGDIAHYLSGLYVHQIKLLSESNLHDDIKKLDEVISVTKVLLETWNEEVIYDMAK